MFPPCSPDLNPMDFSIWEVLDKAATYKSHKTIDSLKKSLKKAWEEVSCVPLTTKLSKVFLTFARNLKAYRKMTLAIIFYINSEKHTKIYLKSICHSKVNFKGKFPIIYAAPCISITFPFFC